MKDFTPITLPSRPQTLAELNKFSHDSDAIGRKLANKNKKVMRRALRQGRIRSVPRTFQGPYDGAVKG